MVRMVLLCATVPNNATTLVYGPDERVNLSSQERYAMLTLAEQDQQVWHLLIREDDYDALLHPDQRDEEKQSHP